MELPKHTTQVGTIATNKKLYLEDYCISYMKQLTEEFPEDRKQIALFGTVEKEKNVEYALAYGAALLGKGRGRTDSLTNSQKEEAEIIRAEFFGDYQLIGVVISTDSVNENVFWLGCGTKSIPMDGYYIFYDTNEAMLNFMMENQKEERNVDLDPVIIKKADMDREKREKAAKEKEESIQKAGKYRKTIQNMEKSPKLEKRKNRSPYPAVACVLLLGICGVYGAKTYYPDLRLEEIGSYFDELRGKATTMVSSYLGMGESDLLLAENEMNEDLVDVQSESLEKNEFIISSETVEAPADMNVVVIPELDGLENTSQDILEASVPSQEQMSSELQVVPNEQEQQPVLPSEQQQELYLIQRGDNLLKILRFHYGDETKLREICDLNGIVDPNNIQVGQTILLP